ncbi:MAG: four helix bundle protein [Treponema sp.]|jgi:four helix bundle protein|nr:four helix bundle protein [Treponema sp.]
MIKTFKDLTVWQEAMNLVEMIYRQTKIFPKEEMYGMTSQIRRAAVSIPANIAEGNGRKSRKEYLQFLSIANGSASELETHLLIAERLNYLAKDSVASLQIQLQSVGRLLSALRKSLIPSP